MLGIYMIRNKINNKVYIGQSVNLKDRIAHHKSSLRHNRHDNSYLQRSWNKYHEENFEFSILEECESEDELDELERKYILEYDSMNHDHGYNFDSGGSLNKHMSEDVKRRLSEMKKGKRTGPLCYFYGKHIKHTEEFKRKLSERMSGAGNPMYGVHLKPTEEQRRRASERMSGAGNPFYGKHHTQETKDKISATKIKFPVRCVETGKEYESYTHAMKTTGIHAGSIRRAAINHLTAGGYHWEHIA